MPRWIHLLLLLAFLQGASLSFNDSVGSGVTGLLCLASWAFNVFAFRYELFGEAR